MNHSRLKAIRNVSSGIARKKDASSTCERWATRALRFRSTYSLTSTAVVSSDSTVPIVRSSGRPSSASVSTP